MAHFHPSELGAKNAPEKKSPSTAVQSQKNSRAWLHNSLTF